jgi:hypothetical protein
MWNVKILTATGKGTTTVEDGVTTYHPKKAEWLTVKTFKDYEKADIWLCKYIKDNGIYYGDCKIVKA